MKCNKVTGMEVFKLTPLPTISVLAALLPTFLAAVNISPGYVSSTPASTEKSLVDGNIYNSCNFEHGTCIWKNSDQNYDDFIWHRVSNGTRFPTQDHTFGNKTGHFMKVTVDNYEYGYNEVAWFDADVTITSPGGGCMVFYYQIKGSFSNLDVPFTVYTQTKSSTFHNVTTPKKLWGREIYANLATETLKWEKSSMCSIKQDIIEQKVVVGLLHGEQRVIFEANSGGTFNRYNGGTIAIDDVTIENEVCPSPVDCTFETGLCGWSNQGMDNMNWQRHQGKTELSYTGPDVDHTLGTSKGWYLWLNSKGAYKDNWGIFASQKFGDVWPGDMCLTFWYLMYTTNAGLRPSLRVSASGSTSSSGKSLFKINYAGPKIWERVVANVPKSIHISQVVIVGTVGDWQSGDIGVDDISLAPGSCGDLGYGFQCNFELRDTCGMVQDANNALNWTTRAPKWCCSGRLDIFPWYDHTMKSSKGYYLFASLPPRQSNFSVFEKHVRIATPAMKATVPYCLDFFYATYGTQIELEVSFRYSGTDNSAWKITGFSATNDRDPYYSRRYITWPGNTFVDYVQIVFSAVGISTYKEVAAVDDIKITPGFCAVKSFNCTFEGKYRCGFDMVAKEARNFDLNSFTINRADVPPAKDHTTGTIQGFWWTFYHDLKKPSEKGALISPPVSIGQEPSGTQSIMMTDLVGCLEFWYYLTYSSGQLVVYVTTDTEKHELGISHFVERNWGRSYTKVQYLLPRGEYQILFESYPVLNTTQKYQLALDDVSVTPDACIFPTTTTTTTKATKPTTTTTTTTLKTTTTEEYETTTTTSTTTTVEQRPETDSRPMTSSWTWWTTSTPTSSKVHPPVVQDTHTGTKESSSHVGLILGITLPCIILLLVVIAGLLYFIKFKRNGPLVVYQSAGENLKSELFKERF